MISSLFLRMLRSITGRAPRTQLETTDLQTPPPSSEPRTVYRTNDDHLHRDSQDIVRGLRFSATLQVRTPLAVLQHHGEIFNGPPTEAPRYGGQADGIWVPQLKSWNELGFDLPEPEEGEHASDAGPVRASEYLPFLLDFRRIVEAGGGTTDKLSRLERLRLESPANARFWRKLQRFYPGFPESFFYREFTTIPGIGFKTAASLYNAGYESLADLARASLADLKKVAGVGPKSAQAIRDYCQNVARSP